MLLKIWARSFFNPLSEVIGLSEHEVVVVKSERLKRRGGVEPFGGEVGGVRAVEGGHKPIGSGANNEAVDAPPPKFGTVRRDVIILGGIGLLVGKVLESRAARLVVQFAANQENRIADGFRIHASRVLPPEQTVGSVFPNPGILVGENGLLAVGFAQEDFLKEGFQGAVVLLESIGQPVEQFRMGWAIPPETKVARGGDKSISEGPLPEAVGDHPVGEGVVCMSDPICQGFFLEKTVH